MKKLWKRKIKKRKIQNMLSIKNTTTKNFYKYRKSNNQAIQNTDGKFKKLKHRQF